MKSSIIDATKFTRTLPSTEQIQKAYDFLNGHNEFFSSFESLARSTFSSNTIYNEAVFILFKETFPPSNATQKLQDTIRNYYKKQSVFNDFSQLHSLLNANLDLNLKVLNSTFNILSTINLRGIEEHLVSEEVQEEFEHEISALQEQTNPQKIWDTMNNYAEKLMDYQENQKQKSPAIYVLAVLFCFIFQLFIAPAMQDIFKENVLHVSEFTSNKPEENAKQIKTSLEKNFGIALSAVNKVRVTNRETPVFRSYQRTSGTIDTIPYNKPVIIIEKKRNWSFVMYTNSLDEEVNGWVFTGNLSR
ncbi:hypothetical protein CBR59_28755 [Bacillus thuringiensis]|uniref:SH3 domain-containing protein n=1 Tax=Bacillus thuringiensis TaxID=1428 RepID=UPI000C9EB8C7|nr:SH3 domain-containing protein [Bacillus thuringiensis]PNK23169.1 hypothetical protein CBP87_29225 [Bacillus thuringiensis]PNK47628.1 hypothetical protein CBR59_28755 [Bacillus thuringiensis]